MIQDDDANGTAMRYRILGRSGIRVSELMLGAMTFGDPSGPGADRDACSAMLDHYLDLGGNVVDTAVNYRGGESEQMLGDLLDGRRDRVVVSTKFTVTRDPSDPNAAGGHRKNLRASIDTSLRRLRTDHIDLYWVHFWDRLTPIEETVHALDDLVRSGKVLALGISDTPAWVIAEANTYAAAHGLSGFDAVQLRYSLLSRDAERDLLPMAERFGMTVAVWSPLAGGLLSGKYTLGDPGASTGRLAGSEVADSDHAIVRLVGEIAEAVGSTPAQVALAWLRTRGPRVHPIVGATTPEQLADNLGALGTELGVDDVRRLDEASTIPLGFPHDFITELQEFVFGAVGARVDAPPQSS